MPHSPTLAVRHLPALLVALLVLPPGGRAAEPAASPSDPARAPIDIGPFSLASLNGGADGTGAGALRPSTPRLAFDLPSEPGPMLQRADHVRTGGVGVGNASADLAAVSDRFAPATTTEYRFGPRFSASLNVSGFPSTDFRLGSLKTSWDSAWRYELQFSGHLPLNGHVEPLFGAYFYFEEREWADGSRSVFNDVWGLGLDLAAMLYPMPRADERPFNVALMPFARIGIGFNDGGFSNVPVPGPQPDTYSSGTIGSGRVELSIGAEARLVLLRRITVGIGAGFLYWDTFDVSAAVLGGAGVVIIRDSPLSFRGTDVFARITVGFIF